MNTKLVKIFNELFASYGPQGWWPTTRDNSYPEYLGGPINDDERFEVMIGAILTQNTSWKNVEKAILNLIKEKALNPKKIIDLDDKKIGELIKPAGYFNQKAKKLKILSEFVINNPIEELKKLETDKLRIKLLNVHGVGPETADSILLYALSKPIPIVDAYTKRIFTRIGFLDEKEDYNQFQEFQINNFPNECYNLEELHALLVEHAKQYCTKNNPDCWMCPIYKECERNF